MPQPAELALSLLTDLRKELVESQRIRAQAIGFKITLISTGAGLILGYKLPLYLLMLPAFAAVFFDLLITSYSFSIKRIGYYIRHNLEPVLAEKCEWPANRLLPEEFMVQPEAKQNLSFWGHLGITILTCGIGVAGILVQDDAILGFGVRWLITIVLLGFVALDMWSFRLPSRFSESAQPKSPPVSDNTGSSDGGSV